jgi:hypothetical protein
MFRDPRREDYTIGTAVAPDAVFHGANVRHPTNLGATLKARPLVRKFGRSPAPNQQVTAAGSPRGVTTYGRGDAGCGVTQLAG